MLQAPLELSIVAAQLFDLIGERISGRLTSPLLAQSGERPSVALLAPFGQVLLVALKIASMWR